MPKTCSKCGQQKSEMEFYSDHKHADGLRSDCKECTKSTTSKYYLTHKDHLANMAALRRAENRDKYRSASKKYRNTEKRRAVVKAWSESHRDAVNAKAAVERAVKLNLLVKPAMCEWCRKETYLVGHHEDYSKRLDVTWLCSPCHKIAHKELSI